jgi:transcriptional regulator of acetoin/glycerol metabolism
MRFGPHSRNRSDFHFQWVGSSHDTAEPPNGGREEGMITLNDFPVELGDAVKRPGVQRMERIRDDFQSSGELLAPLLVTDAVQASWLRSKLMSIDVDKVKPLYIAEFDTETNLTRSAAPVLRQLADELANEPVSIILTDANGMILQRLSFGMDLTRALDSAGLSPGFSYAEENVGTNGIGTALERRAPTLIDGAEHYTRHLSTFSCAGVPILHPISGALLGILDLTSQARDSNPLLLVVAKSTAHRIQQQLLSQSNASELALFATYLAATKHGEDCVLAVGQDLTILSAFTERHFDAVDRAALLARSEDVAGVTEPSTLLADLPSGHTARMDYQPVFAGLGLAGGVFRIQRTAPQDSKTIAARALVSFPGVVGASAIWQQACRAVDRSHRRGEWLILEGEVGVGKLALIRGVHQLRNPGTPFRVLDANQLKDADVWLDSVAEALRGDGGTLVLRHVDLLPAEIVEELATLLLESSPALDSSERLWVTMTISADSRNPQVDAQLLPHFPHTIEVPPLRRHMEDLHSLVPQLLGRIQREDTLTVSASAMDQLMRLPWRGNIDYLRRVLTGITRLRRAGIVTIDDLPAECRSARHRQFTQMEALERDAVVRALVSHQGNKDRAAHDLGVSRSTIYRKIREFGIVWMPDTLDPA